jgi:hypothetical protein
VNLLLGEILIAKNLTVRGNGPAATQIGRAAVPDLPSFRIFHSEISFNGITARGIFAFGGGINSSLTGAGGTPSFSIQRSIVRSNDATGPVSSGGGLHVNGPASSIDRTEISGNTAAGTDDLSEGGGLSVTGNDLVTVTNSTIAGNRADEGSGVYGGDSGVATNLLVTNGTVAGNFAVNGAAVDSDAAITQLRNTILSNPNSNAECAGAIQDLGNNLWFGAAQGTCPASIPNADPNLGPLGPNGGTNQTMALENGGAAIDAGANCPSVDQRGFLRPAGAACDIGAYEFTATLPDTTPPSCTAATPVFINPKQMDVTVTDTGRGFQSISGVNITNGTFLTPYFTPGTTLPVKVVAIKANQSASTSVSFRPFDQAGNNKLCA